MILGGGRGKFLPNIPDPEYPEKTGERSDGRNLIQVFESNKIYAYNGIFSEMLSIC